MAILQATRQYVEGFYFDAMFQEVALIRKDHPDMLSGKLTGIGGKIEQGESPIQCMIREFKEEACAHIENWKRFAILRGQEGEGNDFMIHCFYTTGIRVDVKSMTSEIVQFVKIQDLPSVYSHSQLEVLPNVNWLIMMAISMELGEHAEEFIITEMMRSR